jgi:hypothetical protein
MATTAADARCAALPDEETLAAATLALEEHGFSVEVVDDLNAARCAVLDRIPKVLVASASGSQLGQYAWGADQVIFVVGAQKIVPTVEAGRERIFEHSLPLEDVRAYAAYGMNSRVGKILEIRQEDPGRIHIVIVREAVGF